MNSIYFELTLKLSCTYFARYHLQLLNSILWREAFVPSEQVQRPASVFSSTPVLVFIANLLKSFFHADRWTIIFQIMWICLVWAERSLSTFSAIYIQNANDLAVLLWTTFSLIQVLGAAFDWFNRIFLRPSTIEFLLFFGQLSLKLWQLAILALSKNNLGLYSQIKILYMLGKRKMRFWIMSYINSSLKF